MKRRLMRSPFRRKSTIDRSTGRGVIGRVTPGPTGNGTTVVTVTISKTVGIAIKDISRGTISACGRREIAAVRRRLCSHSPETAISQA